MNRIYPFTTPQVLTDNIFVDYGGNIDHTTPAQRQAAYAIAEELVSEHINTPIKISTITGSYYYPQYGRTIQLDWGHVQRIREVRFIDTEEDTYYTVEGTANVHVGLRNKDRGVIDILTLIGNCQGCGSLFIPYQFEVVYDAGLPTGTYTSPKMLMALTEASKLFINEFVGYGNEASLVGVTEFRNQEYSEKRSKMHNTVFGSSPKAMLIKNLLSGVRRLMKVGL